MNIKNSKKTHRFLTIVMTLLFAVSVFTVTVFATGTDSSQAAPVTPESSSSASQAAEGSSSLAETPPGDSSSSSSQEEGTGGNVTPGPEGQSSTDSSSGISSVASSASSSVSSQEASSAKPKPQVDQKPVDTQARRVEAIASQAEQATSDPDVLSSQDWSELLSSGSSSQPQDFSTAGTVSDSASSQSTGSGGGISWFLIAGIVLIVLSLCGIAFFIYEQFIKHDDDGFGGPRDISSRSSGKPARKSTESTGFVDISSNSDGHIGESGLESISAPVTKTPAARQAPATPAKQPEVPAESKAPAEPEAPAAPPVQEVVKAQPETVEPDAPAMQEKLPESKASVPEPAKEVMPKSQATPVTESNFNWEKFFNEDEEK